VTQWNKVAKVFDLSSFPYLPNTSALTAFLPFLPPLSIPVGINMDSVLFSLSLSFCSTLALFLGPKDHVGESHEHLQTKKNIRHAYYRFLFNTSKWTERQNVFSKVENFKHSIQAKMKC